MNRTFFRPAMVAALCFATAVILCLPGRASAQEDPAAFRAFQFSFNRVSQAWAQYNDTLKHLFDAKKIPYPGKDILLRFFKSSNEMELWARRDDTSKYILLKNYRVCASSGSLGPKRTEGDRQVPEGFYFIDDFNPKSDYYLSLLLNYPNYTDLVQGHTEKPGGDIYIHGGCVTVGCIPMTDPIIQEVYVLCLNAKLAGQNYIPVHIYPTRFTKSGLNFLGRQFEKDTTRQQFWVNLKTEYDYFEKNHKLQPVMYTPDGKYTF